jgi:hypothetical protein
VLLVEFMRYKQVLALVDVAAPAPHWESHRAQDEEAEAAGKAGEKAQVMCDGGKRCANRLKHCMRRNQESNPCVDSTCCRGL